MHFVFLFHGSDLEQHKPSQIFFVISQRRELNPDLSNRLSTTHTTIHAIDFCEHGLDWVDWEKRHWIMRGAKFTPQRMQKLKKKHISWLKKPELNTIAEQVIRCLNSQWDSHLDNIAVKADDPLRSPNSELVSVYKVWECMLKKVHICMYIYIYHNYS